MRDIRINYELKNQQYINFILIRIIIQTNKGIEIYHYILLKISQIIKICSLLWSLIDENKTNDIFSYILQSFGILVFNYYFILKNAIEIFLQKFKKKEIGQKQQIFAMIKSFLWREKEVVKLVETTGNFFINKDIEIPVNFGFEENEMQFINNNINFYRKQIDQILLSFS